MKIKIVKKELIISLIVFILILSLILFNYKSYIVDGEFNFLLFSISIILLIFSSLLNSIKIENSKKIQFFITLFSLLISFLFSYLIIELLNQNNLFNLNIKHLIFNFIIIIFLHLFIYAVSNSAKATIVISNLLIFILGVANYTVTCFRGTPLVPWDILSIKTAAYVASTYTFEFNYYILLAITLFAFIISLGFKANYKFKKQKINIAFRFCCLITILLFTFTFYKTNIIDYFDFETNLWEPKQEYLNNGFLASFTKQSKNLFNDKPTNYSTACVQDILTEIKEKSSNNEIINETNDSPNIIVIMNESYSDLTVNRKV